MVRKKASALLGATLLGLSGIACADDDEAGEATSTTAGNAAGAPTEAVADGEPIVIGFTNLEGGVISLPEFRHGAEAAAEYVNSELGGVNGRPLELLPCDVDPSPESSIDCANRFVEADVTAVLMGVDIGIDAALPILESAGITLVGHSPFTPAAETAPNAVFFGSSYRGRTVAQLDYVASTGAESVTFFLGDTAVERELVDDLVAPRAEELELDYRTVFYDPTNVDWNVAVATALADDPDAIGVPAAPEPDCAAFVGAARSSGFDGGILAGVCNTFISALGEQAVGVVTSSDLWRVDDPEAAPADKQEELEGYVRAMEAADFEDEVSGYAFSSFSDTVNLAAVLRTVSGDVDSATAGEALHGIAGLDSFMGPVITCGSARTACGDWLLFYEVTSTGQLQALSDDFVDITEALA